MSKELGTCDLARGQHYENSHFGVLTGVLCKNWRPLPPPDQGPRFDPIIKSGTIASNAIPLCEAQTSPTLEPAKLTHVRPVRPITEDYPEVAQGAVPTVAVAEQSGPNSKIAGRGESVEWEQNQTGLSSSGDKLIAPPLSNERPATSLEKLARPVAEKILENVVFETGRWEPAAERATNLILSALRENTAQQHKEIQKECDYADREISRLRAQLEERDKRIAELEAKQ